MQKRIAFTRPDGGVSIIAPAPDGRGVVQTAPAIVGTRIKRHAVYAMKVIKAAEYEMVRVRGQMVRARITEAVEERVLVRPEETEEVVLRAAETRPETDEEFLARIIETAVPVVTKAEYTDADGVVWPPGSLLDRRAALAAGMPFDPLPSRIIDASEIPPDRTFRDAMVERAGKFDFDMPRAREIHRRRLRIERAPLLAALDLDYQRADERGDVEAKAEIAARKQALRDAPAHPDIEAAANPEALKAVRLVK